MQFKIKIPNWGEKIELLSTGLFYVPDKPIITFIEGDGIGPDIWKVTRHVLDQSVQKAYGDKRKIAWTEIYAGEKSWEMGDRSNKAWLPDETIEAIKQYLISIKGPMTTPVAGGIRSINVALRQELDLYICLRPVRHFKNVPSPVKKPELVNIVIFRENTEDIYSGIEFSWDSKEASNIKFLLEKFGLLNKVRFPNTSSFGIKPISIEGSSRLIRSAIEYVINNDRDSLTIVHKGNIMKYTEGSFRNCAYDVAKKEFGAVELDSGPWCVLKNPKTNRQIIIKDVITDAFLQQILTRPKEYSVIATMNLNGDYISDALAAQVGGIGISPGANLNYEKGLALFEATHGTAPKYANLDKVNPSSMILSGEMMLRHIGWLKAADLLIKGIEKAIQEKKVTYDFARLMPSSVEIKCSEFANEIIRYM